MTLHHEVTTTSPCSTALLRCLFLIITLGILWIFVHNYSNFSTKKARLPRWMGEWGWGLWMDQGTKDLFLPPSCHPRGPGDRQPDVAENELAFGPSAIRVRRGGAQERIPQKGSETDIPPSGRNSSSNKELALHVQNQV